MSNQEKQKDDSAPQVAGFKRIPVAIFLIILGLTGIIMPVLPGWIFLIMGVIMLGEGFPVFRERLNRYLESILKNFEKRGRESQPEKGRPDK